jgi:hypothetical protein
VSDAVTATSSSAGRAGPCGRGCGRRSPIPVASPSQRQAGPKVVPESRGRRPEAGERLAAATRAGVPAAPIAAGAGSTPDCALCRPAATPLAVRLRRKPGASMPGAPVPASRSRWRRSRPPPPVPRRGVGEPLPDRGSTAAPRSSSARMPGRRRCTVRSNSSARALRAKGSRTQRRRKAAGRAAARSRSGAPRQYPSPGR